LNTEEGVLRF